MNERHTQVGVVMTADQLLAELDTSVDELVSASEARLSARYRVEEANRGFRQADTRLDNARERVKQLKKAVEEALI